jgi:hypothetical protein
MVVSQNLAQVQTIAYRNNHYGTFRECVADKSPKEIFFGKTTENKDPFLHEDLPLKNCFRYGSSSDPQSLGSRASLSPSPTRL